MRAAEILRNFINLVDEGTQGVSASDWEKSNDLPKLKDPKLTNPDRDTDDTTAGRFVGRNRQIAYMKPIDPDKDLNLSVGLGKPQMRNLHGKGQSAVVTIGGNPGDKKNFAGVQLSQPLGKDASGQRQGPGISAVYRRTFE